MYTGRHCLLGQLCTVTLIEYMQENSQHKVTTVCANSVALLCTKHPAANII